MCNQLCDLFPVSTIPLPFSRCRFAVADSRCRFRTPLSLPLPLQLRIFLLFTAVTERNGIFLRNFYRTTEYYNGRTTKRQRKNFKNGNGMVETRHYTCSYVAVDVAERR